MNQIKRRLALISVFNKLNLVGFAQDLIRLGFDIIASGGTAKMLLKADIPVRDVAELVGGNAILGHKVVTLSREISAGILADYIKELEEMEELGLPFIDLLCVDLYPLKKEISKPEATKASVKEKTDVGGVNMLHAAAKSERIVISRFDDRVKVLAWLEAGEPDKENFVAELAATAEFIATDHLLASTNYLGKGKYHGVLGEAVTKCKYGENAYQGTAILYKITDTKNGIDEDLFSLDKFKLIEGTEPSYNNMCDLDRLVQTVSHIAATFHVNRGGLPFIAVGVKHGNACGAGIGNSPREALLKMVAGDPLALFGGLVMVNFPIGIEEVEILQNIETDKKILFDAVAAQGFSTAAIEALRRKKGKCRLLENMALGLLDRYSLDRNIIVRSVRGGFLIQENYGFILDLRDERLIKYGELEHTAEDDMLLAKAICDTSNSNTITIVKNGMLLGNGVGQQARVHGAAVALYLAKKAGHDVKGAVAASDSFFIHTDAPQLLHEAGITGIISTSGSIKDKEVIQYCQDEGIILYLIPDTVGRGFFNH